MVLENKFDWFWEGTYYTVLIPPWYLVIWKKKKKLEVNEKISLFPWKGRTSGLFWYFSSLFMHLIVLDLLCFLSLFLKIFSSYINYLTSVFSSVLSHFHSFSILMFNYIFINNFSRVIGIVDVILIALFVSLFMLDGGHFLFLLLLELICF